MSSSTDIPTDNSTTVTTPGWVEKLAEDLSRLDTDGSGTKMISQSTIESIWKEIDGEPQLAPSLERVKELSAERDRTEKVYHRTRSFRSFKQFREDSIALRDAVNKLKETRLEVVKSIATKYGLPSTVDWRNRIPTKQLTEPWPEGENIVPTLYCRVCLRSNFDGRRFPFQFRVDPQRLSSDSGASWVQIVDNNIRASVNDSINSDPHIVDLRSALGNMEESKQMALREARSGGRVSSTLLQLSPAFKEAYENLEAKCREKAYGLLASVVTKDSKGSNWAWWSDYDDFQAGKQTQQEPL